MSGAVLSAGVLGFLAGSILFGLFWYRQRKKEGQQLRALTDYLEQINLGKAGLVFPPGEDEYSRLQDEIYKTVSMMRQTRDQALEEKQRYAENLANIAHQIRTPVTAVSLLAQGLEAYDCGDYPGQIRRQTDRLVYLEEALLLLSRIDAGALPLERRKTDVFTLLMLAADNLQEHFSRADVRADIPEQGTIGVFADPDWTMEALMNLMKNCIEHTPPGKAVHCSYEKNPMYVEIRIRDEGPGFSAEDMPRLFERFYRGTNASDGGIGIGLSLAKEIVRMQNGTIRVENMPDGGGCFTVRFYCDGSPCSQ